MVQKLFKDLKPQPAREVRTQEAVAFLESDLQKPEEGGASHEVVDMMCTRHAFIKALLRFAFACGWPLFSESGNA
jgi:peptide methionine sulfoxide reductase MsrB